MNRLRQFVGFDQTPLCGTQIDAGQLALGRRAVLPAHRQTAGWPGMAGGVRGLSEPEDLFDFRRPPEDVSPCV
jgi:hypothetical protein